jgi:protoporphyrinogen oxidase
MTVAILGAGISGLVAARALLSKGIDVELLEAQDQPGGLCRSDTVDGYVMDRAGGHIVFSRHEAAMQYYHELFEDEPLVRTERHTRILFKGRYIPYPFENGIGELSQEDRVHCLQGIIAAALARSDGAVKPQNFGDWIRWHVGDGINQLFMEPYNQKIWKLDDLREMGISWVDGRIPEAPISDIVRAARGVSTVGYGHQAVFYYPQQRGFQDLTDRIAAKVRDHLHLNTLVTDVSRLPGGSMKVNGKSYDAVISTLPMPVLASLVSDLDSTTREAAAGLGFISLACFLFGIPQEDVQPLSWIYLPHADQGPANRVTYLSNYSPGNAPSGRGSLMAEVTFRGSLEVTSDYLKDLRNVLAGQGLMRADQVSVEEFRLNRYAYIHFGPDFVERRQTAIDGFEAHGIEPLGRFGRYNYYNTDLCILEALEMADKLAQRLGVQA